MCVRERERRENGRDWGVWVRERGEKDRGGDRGCERERDRKRRGREIERVCERGGDRMRERGRQGV